MIVGALAGPVIFRMQCLYHDSNGAAILQPSPQPQWQSRRQDRENSSGCGWPNLGSQAT